MGKERGQLDIIPVSFLFVYKKFEARRLRKPPFLLKQSFLMFFSLCLKMEPSNDCVTHAFNAYLRRASRDTNPTIVQLLLPDGSGDSHWYYKSDQVVSTSAFDWPGYDSEYEGPIDKLPDIIKKHFLPNRFKVFDFLTQCAKESLEAGCKNYDDASKMGFGACLRKGD